MSSYLRSIPNKFTSFVIIRRQATNIDQQLTNHGRSSIPFLEECLGVHKNTKVIIGSKEKDIKSAVLVSCHNALYASLNCGTEKQKPLGKKCNWSKHQVIKLYQQIQMNNKEINVANSDLMNVSILKNNANFKIKRPDISHLKINSSKGIFDNALLNSQKESIYNREISLNVQNVNEKQTSEDRKPSDAQLQNVFNILQCDLPKLFVKKMNYKIYTEDMIFINNITGVTTVGIDQYTKQMAFLKVIGHIRFAFVKLNILKMTIHPEDSSIKIRWRITGISGTRIFISFWKFRLWNLVDQAAELPSWYDGFSVFYVNNDGKIFKHVVDKMMPDQDIEEAIKAPVETKLALFSVLLDLDSHYSTKICSEKYPQLSRIK